MLILYWKDSNGEGEKEVLRVYKVGLKWPVIAMAVTRKPHGLSLSP